MVLSTLEIAQMRADQVDYEPDTCTIQTPTRVADDQGGGTASWANTYTDVVCRLSPQNLTTKEGIEGDQLAALTFWVLTVAFDQVLDETMRVVHDSETYEVTRLEDTHSNRTAKRVHLTRLD